MRLRAMLLISVFAPALAGAQAGGEQFYYCAAGMDPERNLYLSEVFAAAVRDPMSIGAAFRLYIEEQFAYEMPLPSVNPCKAFPLADWAEEAKREDAEGSRALRANIIETGWSYVDASAPLD